MMLAQMWLGSETLPQLATWVSRSWRPEMAISLPMKIPGAHINNLQQTINGFKTCLRALPVLTLSFSQPATQHGVPTGKDLSLLMSMHTGWMWSLKLTGLAIFSSATLIPGRLLMIILSTSKDVSNISTPFTICGPTKTLHSLTSGLELCGGKNKLIVDTSD